MSAAIIIAVILVFSIAGAGFAFYVYNKDDSVVEEEDTSPSGGTPLLNNGNPQLGSNNGTSQPQCVANSYYDPSQESCVSCPTGQEVNGDKDGCQPVCTLPQILSGSGDACVCPDRYKIDGAGCIINCDNAGNHRVPNSDNDGCECETGYVDVRGICTYECGGNFVPNENNDGCECKNGYSDGGGICIIDCTGKNRVRNSANDACVCPPDYDSDGADCIINCDNAGLHREPNTDGDACICPENFTLNGANCIINCDQGFEPSATFDACVLKQYEVKENTRISGTNIIFTDAELRKDSSLITLADAKAKCNDELSCKGFTTMADSLKANFFYFMKPKNDNDNFTERAVTGYTSYIKGTGDTYTQKEDTAIAKADVIDLPRTLLPYMTLADAKAECTTMDGTGENDNCIGIMTKDIGDKRQYKFMGGDELTEEMDFNQISYVRLTDACGINSYLDNNTGQCVKCNANQRVNDAKNACEDRCPDADKEYSAEFNTCVCSGGRNFRSDTGQCACPYGKIFVDGNCTCPVDHQEKSDGLCVHCPSPRKLVNDVCVCPDDKQWNGIDACVYKPPTWIGYPGVGTQGAKMNFYTKKIGSTAYFTGCNFDGQTYKCVGEKPAHDCPWQNPGNWQWTAVRKNGVVEKCVPPADGTVGPGGLTMGPDYHLAAYMTYPDPPGVPYGKTHANLFGCNYDVNNFKCPDGGADKCPYQLVDGIEGKGNWRWTRSEDDSKCVPPPDGTFNPSTTLKLPYDPAYHLK